VLYSAEGELLSAITASDGQWRFPERMEVPEKFATAILQFEDVHFRAHSGIYLPSILRAIQQNVRRGKVVRGGSTISMQVIRLSRNNPPRTVREKVVEMFMALRLEWRYSKDEILAFYSSHAPFGGNVVGLDAAAWRYFGHRVDDLTWAEAATLAVLPNAPSLIFPGKNQEKLLLRRNRLLEQLHQSGHLDIETLELSYLEPLPGKPYPLPLDAPHLLTTLCKQSGAGKVYPTSIRHPLQLQTISAIRKHVDLFEPSHVHNAAALIIEVETGKVLAYVGNVSDEKNRYSNMVDVIPARRSSGSILKPFLYASMLNDGLILPKTLVADIPVQYDGFSPKNYSQTYDGAVPASQALSRSLNIPSVIMLKDYSYPRFYHQLKKLGFSHLDQSADHYGLSLILGGAEASLWDVCRAYAGMSRTLNQYNRGQGYSESVYLTQSATSFDGESESVRENYPPLDAASIWTTFTALLEVNRPESEIGWEAYNSSGPIAWKTGTSFGNRDAWAVGTTPEYVVGVWVGNADGQGRPELTGVNAAAPLMFDLFTRLPSHTWFALPIADLNTAHVCRESGMIASAQCPAVDTILVPFAGISSSPCHYHKLLHLDREGAHQVTNTCYSPSEMKNVPWFILPGVQEYYYRKKHPTYLDAPAFADGCDPNERIPISLIYPKSNSPIILPRNLSGVKENTVLRASHQESDVTLFWHLDGNYLGSTQTIHELEIHPEPGSYTLTVIDNYGNLLEKTIRVVRK